MGPKAKLDHYLDEKSQTLGAFAAELGTRATTLYRWFTAPDDPAHRTPRRAMALRIVEKTGGYITLNDLYGLPASATKPAPVAEAAE